jgi:pyruvate dehydrogenase E2 component (dihydrolipoamide acetyltransferase)
MAEVIRMPKMSDTMSEGTIARWNKKVGDVIKSGDILAEVETDKATMDMESYQEGTLLYIGVQEGDAVAVDAIMAIVGAAGEDYHKLLAPSPEREPIQPVAIVTTPTVTPTNSPSGSGATAILMPKMSDTMTEGTLVAWLKKVGDVVKSGDIIAEVETDKATMELENYEDGTLLYIGVEVGQAVPVDAIIAIVGEAGADYKALLNPGQTAEIGSQKSEVIGQQPQTTESLSSPVTQSLNTDTRLKASPLAKALAKEKGIDLSKIAGSGEGGRIIKKDVVSEQLPVTSYQLPVGGEPLISEKLEVKSEKPFEPITQNSELKTQNYTDTPVSQMRKTIARRLSESLFTAPHFYLTMEITMDKASALRAEMNTVASTKISFNDFVIKACSLALKQHPAVNSSWLGDKIRTNHVVNIGVAVAVEEGLLVPVVRDADKKTMSVIGAEVKDYAAKAKDKKLQPKDWEGNTFSISNLGMFGIDEFTAIINPPDACILAVGGIKQTAAFREDGTVYPTNIMKVTLSCDHRVVDGATGAAFLQTVKKLLENPMLMLI